MVLREHARIRLQQRGLPRRVVEESAYHWMTAR